MPKPRKIIKIQTLRSVFLDWKKKYLADCKKEAPEYVTIADKQAIKDHVDFFRDYVGCMAIGNETRSNIGRIKRFLSMQRKQDPNKMVMRFLGGSPVEIWVYVDSKQDIDIADTYALTDFSTLVVGRPNEQKWTKKTAESFVQEVRDDLEFDGYEPKLNYIFNKMGVEINCQIDE